MQGLSGSDYLDPKDMERIVTDLGRTLRQRTTLYETGSDSQNRLGCKKNFNFPKILKKD